MTPAELRAVVLRLAPHQPITDVFEAEHRQADGWAGNQQVHLERWLGQYNTPGAYTRSRLDGDARDFYQHFRNVGGLLWLAESLGIDRDLLKSALVDVLAAGPNWSSQCGAFRRRVPWTLIEPLAAEKLASRPKRGRLSEVLSRVRR